MTTIVNCEAEAGDSVSSVVQQRLKKMPPEVVESVLELVKCLREEEGDEAREHISRTLLEIIFPESIRSIRLPVGEADEREARQKLNDYRKKVGEQIRRRREEMEMTQDQLADATGLSQSHVCRLEVGKHAPTYATMERIAKALNTSPDQLDPGFPDE